MISALKTEKFSPDLMVNGCQSNVSSNASRLLEAGRVVDGRQVAKSRNCANARGCHKPSRLSIVDQTGKIIREGTVASQPRLIAAFVKSHARHVAPIGLGTGPTSTWLWTELNKMRLPIICIDARHAKAALKMQINKSDRNDAVGIARIMQCGWYKEVRVKDLDSHAGKALLVSRALLVKSKRDLENQVRGLLKNLGLVIGREKMNVFSLRVAELTEDRHELNAVIEPLMKAREAIERLIEDLHRKAVQHSAPQRLSIIARPHEYGLASWRADSQYNRVAGSLPHV
jgi:transposase